MEITRHFTASCYIVFNNKVLLHKHKKYDKYLPVGGHIDRDETPVEAVMREVKEESGLDIELFSKDLEKFDESEEINIGHTMNIHFVNPFHQHMDFIYFAKSFSDKTSPKEGESKELIWASIEDLDKLNLYPNTKKYAKIALETLS